MIWCNRDPGSPKMPRDMCHSTAPFPVSSNEILAQFHLTFLVARVFPIRGGKELNQEYKSIQKYMQWACGCASILVPSHTFSYHLIPIWLTSLELCVKQVWASTFPWNNRWGWWRGRGNETGGMQHRSSIWVLPHAALIEKHRCAFASGMLYI